MKRKSKGNKSPSSAKVFIVSIGVSMLVLLIGMIIFLAFFFKENNLTSQDEEVENFQTNKFAQTQNLNILVGVVQDDKLEGLMIAKLSPQTSEILTVTIPINSHVKLHAKNDTLENHFNQDGEKNLVDAVKELLGIDIPRYIILKEDSFDYLCQKLGGVYYTIEKDIYYNNPQTSEITNFKKSDPLRLFYGEDIRKIITYPNYKRGEIESAEIFAQIFTSLVNQSVNFKSEIAKNLDLYADRILTMATTNLSLEDYKNAKSQILWIYESSKKPSSVFLIKGKMNVDGEYILDSNSQENVRRYLGE